MSSRRTDAETETRSAPATGTGNDPAAETVSLRPLRPEHAARLAALELRNREELQIGAPAREDAWFTEAGQREAIEQALAAAQAGLGMPFVITVGDEAGQRLVGRLSITAIVRGAFQSASLGYWVDREEWGRGVATRAVRTAIGVAFGGLKLHRLQAEVQVGNDASVRVLERCGFAEYGLAPQYLHLGGRWRDCRLFQLVHADGEPSESAGAIPSPMRRASPSPDSIEIRAETPALADALGLYRAVGWSAYAEEPGTLQRALAGSARVVTARLEGELVGLARVISDGATIAYLQDVLVHPGQQRRGVGRRLVEQALAPFADLRQHVLLTDSEPAQRAFYESLGLTEVHDHPFGLRAFVRFR